jgi:hypothetical protein
MKAWGSRKGAKAQRKAAKLLGAAYSLRVFFASLREPAFISQYSNPTHRSNLQLRG